MSTTLDNYWLSRADVAKRLHIAPKTLANWGGRGEGPAFSRMGGRVRYRLDDVVAWERSLSRGGDAA